MMTPDRELFGCKRLCVRRAAQPLVEALGDMGAEIGSARLNTIASLMGFAAKPQWQELRVIAVRLESREHVLPMLLSSLRSRMSDDDIDAVSPIAAFDIDDSDPTAGVMVAFLNALGTEATLN